jgi:hypothetical protein
VISGSSNTLVVILLELGNDAGHVVCSGSLIDIWGKDFTHHVLNDPCQLITFELMLLSFLSDDLAGLLVLDTVPDTITSNDDVLIMLGFSRSHTDVWEAGYSLVFWA